MKLSEFKACIEKYPIFRSTMLGHFTSNVNQLRRQLSEWKEKGYFRHLAFVGGTASRILFNLNRSNYAFLNSAILQTEHKQLDLTQPKLVALLEERIRATNFSEVCRDVGAFLLDQRELRFFNQDSFLKLCVNLV